MYWSSKDHILLRMLRLGRASYVYPMTVVEDNPDFCALYLAAGTPTKERKMPDGSPLSHGSPYAERHAATHRVGDGLWRENSVLQLTKPGEAHSFWAFWREADGEFLGWYVNLQAPLKRTELGFDTEDHVLDIWLEPGGDWTWKDEAELTEAVEVGRFTRREADAIRLEGERAVEKIEAGEWPLGAGWEDWRPGVGWVIPDVSAGWERI